MLTGCKLEDQIDVDVGFLDDWVVDGWFNDSIDDKDEGDDGWTVVDWMVGGSDDVKNKNGWIVDKVDDKDGWLGVDVWTIIDWMLGVSIDSDVWIVDGNVTVDETYNW